MPVYAECGGLMYLGEHLVLDGKTYDMAGILPVTFGFSKRPQGHGYTILQVAKENPYYAKGVEIRGHEFHYSRVIATPGPKLDLVFDVQRGQGLLDGKDGICYQNVLATYTHVHAFGTPAWAETFVQNAIQYRAART